MTEKYTWTDNPTVSGVAICDTDILNDCLMHLKYENKSTDILTTNLITNCITEIPQDIKLELNEGVLTLKAGSKVYVPNGFEDDGITPKFDEVVVESDIAYADWAGRSRDIVIYLNANSNQLTYNTNVDETYSGDVAPALTHKFAVWYDIQNNIIKHTNDTGATWESNFSLPIAVCYQDADMVLTSIKEIFNGYGYIGSTVFVLPNIKGLIPNGKNEDGSLNNIEFVASNVITKEYTATNQVNHYLALLSNNTIGWYSEAYVNKDNKLIVQDGNSRDAVIFGNIQGDTTSHITSFTTKQPFRALDYSEFNLTPHITETYQNGTSGYIVYSNGYCEQWGRVNINFTANRYNDYTITLLKPYKNTDYNILAFAMDRGDIHNSNIAYYTITSTNWVLRTYTVATQNDKTACWRTCGYIA